jgi:gamma-glutamylcyclotransferase (GGCT)/AIG2-like uncharacterized protein YtfP
MMNQVFVYGSLSKGMIHFDKIESAVVDVKEAWLIGAAYQLRVGYPVILKEGQQRIHGQLVEVSNPDLMIPLLDSFYGFLSYDLKQSLHIRESINVNLVSERSAQSAWVYFLNPTQLPKSASLIVDGDWLEQMKKPKLTDQLTDRQKNYIKKLAAASGREVVPIDLSLYRELMSLELIIDKGRRLALSQLGQEVCRYLVIK